MGSPYTELRAKWTLLTRNSATKVTLLLFLFLSLYPSLSLCSATTFNPLFWYLALTIFVTFTSLSFAFTFSSSTTFTSTSHYLFTSSSHSHYFSLTLLSTSYHHLYPPLLLTANNSHRSPRVHGIHVHARQDRGSNR